MNRVETEYPFDDGFPVYYHSVHPWFAWRPVFVPDRGWVWLRMVHRQFTSKMHANGITTWVSEHWVVKPNGQPENTYNLARPAPIAQKEEAR